MIYLDNNSTTKIDPRVVEAMVPYLDSEYGNPSSTHKFGKKSWTAIQEAREKVANLIGAKPDEIFFTSCATEANNWAIKGIAWANKKKGNHIITTKIEHKSVLAPCKKWLEQIGFKVTYLNVDKYGVVDLDELKDSITDKTILISIMYANNEVGTIEPMEEIGKIAKEHNIYFYTDAVQAVGKLSVNVNEINVDLLSLSGHKLYGPKGVGALYIRKGTKITPLLHGGGHEKGMRSGTENVAGIVGLGKACEIAKEENETDIVRIKNLRDKLEKAILEKIEEVIINGHPEKRLTNTLNLCIKYIEGESVVLSLDYEGICVSTASACASHSLEPSHVLLAMGIPPEIAQSALRFSLGKYTTEEEIEKVIDVLPRVVARLREMSPFWKH